MLRHQNRLASFVIGAALLAQALVLRWLFSADEARVYWLKSALAGECSLRARFGIPCPTCGMTRSVVLSLHGEFARAWRIAPGGPAWVAAYLTIACLFFVLGYWQWRTGRALPPRLRSLLITAVMALCIAASMIWLFGWIGALLTRQAA